VQPTIRRRDGRELGNAAAAAAVCKRPVKPATFTSYANKGIPACCPAPRHVAIDEVTGQRLYWLREVRAWDRRRPGKGNWGGIGAKARQRETELAATA
jgi:hypothetical protein